MMQLIQQALRIQMTPQRLMSEASKIITFDVAKQFDGAYPKSTPKTVAEACLKLVGEEHFSSLPAEDVDLYLEIVVRTVRRAIVSDLPTLTFAAAKAGNNFYRSRFPSFIHAEQYIDAERQARKAFECMNLLEEPNWGRMFALHLLGIAKYYQGKVDESKQHFQEALAEFERLDVKQKADEDVQQVANEIKDILTHI
ncbi:MAG TPA: tetratricopeptide repeat protein [Ktedonobacteraceae bacterium]|nr:tetratricopeptide repeat protein [Ktedonobacteraceae bacterium]